MTLSHSGSVRRRQAARGIPDRGVRPDRVALRTGLVTAAICTVLPFGCAAWLTMGGPSAAAETAARGTQGEDQVQPPEASAVPENRDPLADVLEWMAECEKRLKSGDTGRGTRQLQESVVKGLEELIRRSENASASSSASAASSWKSPSQTQKDGEDAATETKPGGTQAREGTALGANGGGDTATDDLRMALQRVWGELPPRERDLLLQQGTESFLPKYRPMIEAYFRRLSEGRSARANGGMEPGPRLPRSEGRE